MAYSNSQILAAVINKWAQPAIKQFAATKLQSFPFIQALENKVKSTGWVSPNWNITSELAPMIEPISGGFIRPMLNRYFSQVPDDAIPAMAHNIVDKALEQGKLELFEGKVIFEKEDLEELKNLLNYNMPLLKEEEYIVKTSQEETTEM